MNHINYKAIGSNIRKELVDRRFVMKNSFLKILLILIVDKKMQAL